MRKLIRSAVLTAVAVMVLAGVAYTADQAILGRTFLVKNPGTPTQRKVAANAKEKNSPNTLVGNPTLTGSAGGAILAIFVDGGTSANQAFVLNQGTGSTGKPFWSATSTGFKYRDSRGDQGPVKLVLIRRTPSGAFSLKAQVNGRNGTVNIVPPNPGTDACVSLKLGIGNLAVGDRYHAQYAPPAVIQSQGSKLFKVKKPANEGFCPAIPPTTSTTTTTTPPTTASTTTTTSSTTTTTTLYGSPSRAFLLPVDDLLD